MNESVKTIVALLECSNLDEFLSRAPSLDWAAYNTQVCSQELSFKSVGRLLYSSENLKVLHQYVPQLLKSGWDPTQEPVFWDLHNLHFGAPVCKTMFRHLVGHGFAEQILHHVCQNYLVHPSVLKTALTFPSVAACVPSSRCLENVWEGNPTSRKDNNDIMRAHNMLLEHNAPISRTVLDYIFDMLQYGGNSKREQQALEILYENAQALHSKQSLLNSIEVPLSQRVPRKM